MQCAGYMYGDTTYTRRRSKDLVWDTSQDNMNALWQAAAAHHHLHLLLVHRKVGCLCGQLSTPREAQHVLKLSVPSHAVGVLVLEEHQLVVYVIH